MKRSTSFGTIEKLIERNGEVVTELLYFEREGRGHAHDSWENCYILSGSGWIMVGEKKVAVRTRDVCCIPPQTNHWMIPESHLEILLVYSLKTGS